MLDAARIVHGMEVDDATRLVLGNQFTANAGANTRELMARMGHDSERAALIYLHSSDKRQRALADAVAKAARACQWPSYGPRWWPVRSPHPSG
jgi:hypothetical protein